MYLHLHIFQAFRELTRKLIEDKRAEERSVGEFGLYYENKPDGEEGASYEHPDIKHVAPQHR